MLIVDNQLAWEDFMIIGGEANKFGLGERESLFIKRSKPSLDKNQLSQ